MAKPRSATLAVQSGMEGHIIPPISIAKTTPWNILGMAPGHTYSRTNADPTVSALEQVFSGMHDGAQAIVTSSGQGAMIDILATVKPGEHIIAGKQIYGGTRKYIENYFSRSAEFTLVDPKNIEELENAIKPGTRYLFIETPTNPLLDIIDLEKIQAFSQKHKIPYILDNTFATHHLLDGFKFGARIVYYSASKYLNGHHNAIGAVIVTKDKDLADEMRQHRRYLAHSISSEVASRIHSGLATLELRMNQQCENAEHVSKYLASHPKIAEVYYPGLASHPNHEIAKFQMKRFGGIISFKLASGSNEFGPEEFANNIANQNPPVIRLSESLGSVTSLLAHPETMSHRSMTPEQMAEIGVDHNLFRLSVGIEDYRDIIESLENGLEAMKN